MYRKIVLILSIVFIFSSVSAISTDLKETYKQKETMIVKISGAIVEQIKNDQIYFKRSNNFVPVEYQVGRVGNDWFLWAVAPESKNNYTLFIDNVKVQSGRGVASEDYQKNFSVSEEKEDYTIKPGFIITSESFNIDLIVNNNQNNEIQLNFPEEKTITVGPGISTINFPINSIQNTQTLNIKVGKYNVPAQITVYGTTPSQNVNNESTNQTSNSTTVSNQTSVSVKEIKIEVSPSYVQRFVYSGSYESNYQFIVLNKNNLSHKDIEIEFNKSIFEIDENEFDLDSFGNFSFTMVVDSKIKNNISEIIYIKGENISIEIPFFVRFTDNATDIAEFYSESFTNSTDNSTIRRTSFFCSEAGGITCPAGNACSGEVLEGKDGRCCIGICKKPAEQSYAWVGWIIAFLVLGIAWFVYYKYKKAG